MYKYYLELLNGKDMPSFLTKYLNTPSLTRLKNVGYFCGMDFASKNIYNFSEYISRYDHSVTVALLTYYLTKDHTATIAGLYHDISTPCFSHVIDYMNKDYKQQESTEAFTETIINNDELLLSNLKEDNISKNDIIDFKKHSVVDTSRPKLCADRLDGIILTCMGWIKNITKEDITNILNSIKLYLNEESEHEIGFTNKDIAQRVLLLNDSINIFCQSKEDMYMMNLLADITKYAIDKKYITYFDLYTYNEFYLMNYLKSINDQILQEYITTFETITKDDIPNIKYPETKKRTLSPIVDNIRI